MEKTIQIICLNDKYIFVIVYIPIWQIQILYYQILIIYFNNNLYWLQGGYFKVS